MNCRTAEKLVQPYISGELEGSELLQFIEHVKTCRSCYEELETYYTIDATLQLLDDDRVGSYNIRSRLQEDLRRKETEYKREKRRRIISYALIPVILLLAVIFYLLVFRQGLILSFLGA